MLKVWNSLMNNIYIFYQAIVDFSDSEAFYILHGLDIPESLQNKESLENQDNAN